MEFCYLFLWFKWDYFFLRINYFLIIRYRSNILNEKYCTVTNSISRWGRTRKPFAEIRVNCTQRASTAQLIGKKNGIIWDHCIKGVLFIYLSQIQFGETLPQNKSRKNFVLKTNHTQHKNSHVYCWLISATCAITFWCIKSTWDEGANWMDNNDLIFWFSRV